MLDIYPLDLYIWHMPDIRFLRNFGVITLPPIYMAYTYLMKVYVICIHTYGVTGWPPKFRRSSISGICQIYRSSGYMSSLLCNMLGIYLEYHDSIQSETWTWIFQEYARYISNKIWYISHTRWMVSWCWKEKWTVNVHAAQLHDSWVSSISWH